MNGHPEHEGLSPNEQAIMEKELPGRSKLAEFKDNHPELALNEKEAVMSGELKKAEVIIDPEDPEGKRELWSKNIDYIREADPDRPGEDRDTEEIKAVSERVLKYDPEGRLVKTTGTNLDREHSWEETNTYDKQGNLVSIKKDVTEGEKKGETSTESTVKEQVGQYTKETMTRTGKEMIDGQLTDFTTVEVNFLLPNKSKPEWGYHEHNGKRTMEWGKKPADLNV